MPSVPVGDFVALLLLEERARGRHATVPPQHLNACGPDCLPIEVAKAIGDEGAIWMTGVPTRPYLGSQTCFFVKTGTACCKRFDAKKTYLYISRNKVYMDNPHRCLLEICRNHLNNMTPCVNTAISQFGVSIVIEQNGAGKTQIPHTL